MKKFVLPIVATLVGTCFVTYSFLDTFIIPKNTRKVSFSFDNSGLNLPIGGPTSSSSQQSQPSSSSNNNSSSNSSSNNSGSTSQVVVPVSNHQYYPEQLTTEEIAALFTPTKQFAERKHYSDPDIYIDITTNRDAEDTTTYYVADIRINNLGYFRAALAHDTFGQNVTERTSDMCNRKQGILAIDGDTYGSQEGGYVVRNGNLNSDAIRTTKNLERRKPDDLVIKKDGTFEIIDERETSFEQVKAMDPFHVFSFGPALVNKNEITVTENDEVGTAMGGNKNQRCAMGIINPGHYVFVVSDGRMKSSYGLSLLNLANIMKDLHCETAYNLDGGGSATMYLEDGTGNATGLGHLVNYPHQSTQGLPDRPRMQQREVSDIVYIGKNL